jgi:hypothetical protein
MTNEKLSSILGKTNASGNFVAWTDGKKFLDSTSFHFSDTGKEYIIFGNDNNTNWVVFTVPNSLAAEEPHTVEVYPGFIRWNVNRNGVGSNVESGSATVTLAKNLQSVSGTVAFILPDGSNVTGEFAISRL